MSLHQSERRWGGEAGVLGEDEVGVPIESGCIDHRPDPACCVWYGF